MDKARALMIEFAEILKKLNDFEVIRTYGNPVGDYTEFLVTNKLGLVLAEKNSKGYDAYDKERKTKYQIKGRWEYGKPSVKSREFGVVRDYDSKNPAFEYLIAVIFDEDFDVKEAYKIKYSDIPKLGRYRKRENGYKMRLIGKSFENVEKEDITNILKY